MSEDPIRPAIQAAVFLLLYLVCVYIASPLFGWAGGYLVVGRIGGLAASVFANTLSLSIFGGRVLTDVGFPWNRAAMFNALAGVLGGSSAAMLAICLPLALGMARLVPARDPGANWRTVLFVPFLLLCGAVGEEMLFHGFAFQVLLRRFGLYATVLPVGVLFGLLHASNPNVSRIGIANTMGFGILFGIAFLRSHDLWLPTGMHFGWNFILPLFGVNLSGITMKPTGIDIEWKTGPLWSGGDYGPEASVFTSVILILLMAYLWRVPVRKQVSPLCDGPLPSV